MSCAQVESAGRLVSTSGSGKPPHTKKLRSYLLANVTRKMAPAVLAIARLGMASMVPTPAHAAIPVLNIGDTVYNPTTDSTETVTQIVGPATVITDMGFAILLAQTVGDTFTLSDGVNQTTFEVTAVTTTDINGTTHVTSVTLKDLGTSTTQTAAVSQATVGDGAAGTGSVAISFPPPAGSINTIYNVQKGSDGSDGHDGAIVVPASSGGAGATGPTINQTVSGPIHYRRTELSSRDIHRQHWR